MDILKHIENIYCCLLIDEKRFLIGAQDGLICCDLDDYSYHRLNQSKKIYQLAHVPSEQLIVTLSGEQKRIKVFQLKLKLF